MAQDFSRIVEDVKQLSTAEKEELQELLRSYLIRERRREIEQNNGDLKFDTIRHLFRDP